MVFLLFRPVFWVMIGWIIVWSNYVETLPLPGGLVVSKTDMAIQFKKYGIKSGSTTEKWTTNATMSSQNASGDASDFLASNHYLLVLLTGVGYFLPELFLFLPL